VREWAARVAWVAPQWVEWAERVELVELVEWAAWAALPAWEAAVVLAEVPRKTL
jgi:hypothetical protein